MSYKKFSSDGEERVCHDVNTIAGKIYITPCGRPFIQTNVNNPSLFKNLVDKQKLEKFEEFKEEELEDEIKEPTQSLVNSGKKWEVLKGFQKKKNKK